jgi:hypothetical protein
MEHVIRTVNSWKIEHRPDDFVVVSVELLTKQGMIQLTHAFASYVHAAEWLLGWVPFLYMSEVERFHKDVREMLEVGVHYHLDAASDMTNMVAKMRFKR